MKKTLRPFFSQLGEEIKPQKQTCNCQQGILTVILQVSRSLFLSPKKVIEPKFPKKRISSRCKKTFGPNFSFYWLSRTLKNGFEAPQGGIACNVQAVSAFFQDQFVFGSKKFWMKG